MTTLKHIQAMPAPTWHRLKMNDTSFEIPAHLAVVNNVDVDMPADMIGDTQAFDKAVANMQTRLEAYREKHPFVPVEGFDSNGIDETSYSQYQIQIADIERKSDIAYTLQQAMNPDVYGFLHEHASKHIVVHATDTGEQHATIALRAQKDALVAATLDVVAEPHANVEVSILFQPEAGFTSVGEQDIEAACGLAVRVFAGSESNVHIRTVNTLGDTTANIDAQGYILDDGAHVYVEHTVLGGKKSLVGTSADLRGNDAKLDIQTHYLGHGENELDFNYSIAHRGERTLSDLSAHGVLTGASYKVLRGTIDLIKGAKGADGHEVETVLIADERAHNLTIPIILCSEDDVQGEHGATIGHVSDEQKLYLASRGLDDTAIEALFTRAQIERAELYAESDAERDAVVAVGRALLGEYEEVS